MAGSKLDLIPHSSNLTQTLMSIPLTSTPSTGANIMSLEETSIFGQVSCGGFTLTKQQIIKVGASYYSTQKVSTSYSNTTIVWRVLTFQAPVFYMCAHRSMASTNNSTMAASKAARTPFKEVACKNKSKRLKTMLVQKIPV